MNNLQRFDKVILLKLRLHLKLSVNFNEVEKSLLTKHLNHMVCSVFRLRHQSTVLSQLNNSNSSDCCRDKLSGFYRNHALVHQLKIEVVRSIKKSRLPLLPFFLLHLTESISFPCRTFFEKNFYLQYLFFFPQNFKEKQRLIS